MNSSAGDNSTAKTVNPFAPPPEPFHPPRLGIIHLLAWTAVTAVLLKLSTAAGWLDLSSAEFSRALRIFFTTAHSVYAMVLAAGVVGTSVILRARLRGVPGRLQAGHWMVVTVTAVSVFALPFWLLLSVLINYLDPTSSFHAYYYFNTVQSATALLGTALWLVATLRMRESFRWKALFGFFAVGDAISCIIYLASIFMMKFFMMPSYSLAELPVGSAIGFFALPLVVLIDLRHRVQRDWLHWLGVATVFTGEAMHISVYLVSRLLH